MYNQKNFNTYIIITYLFIFVQSFIKKNDKKIFFFSHLAKILHLEIPSNGIIKLVKDVIINGIRQVQIPLLTFDSSIDDCYSIIYAHLLDLKQMSRSDISKYSRMLKVGTSRHFKKGMCFDEFYSSLRKHAIRIYVNIYGWNMNGLLKGSGSGWHTDKKDGGVRILYKVLGEIAYGILKGSLPFHYVIIGETFLLGGIVIAHVLCFSEANNEGYTNLVHASIMQDKFASLIAVIDVHDKHDYYFVAQHGMSLLRSIISNLHPASIDYIKTLFAVINHYDH